MRLLPVNPITLARCRRALEEKADYFRRLIGPDQSIGPKDWQAELASIERDIAAIDTVFAADDAATDPRDALLLQAAQQIGHLRSELEKLQTSCNPPLLNDD